MHAWKSTNDFKQAILNHYWFLLILFCKCAAMFLILHLIVFRHLHNAISATIHELYIHMDNATRFCAMVEVKQFKRDEQNGLNGNYISHFFFRFRNFTHFKSKNYLTYLRLTYLRRLQIHDETWWKDFIFIFYFFLNLLYLDNLWILVKHIVYSVWIIKILLKEPFQVVKRKLKHIYSLKMNAKNFYLDIW